MLVPSWLKPRELVWWNLGDRGRVLCRVTSTSSEHVTLNILYATPDQIILIRRGPGEATAVMYGHGLLELAR